MIYSSNFLLPFLPRFRYYLIHWLGKYPRLYFPAFQIFGSSKSRVVDDQTDVLIEGFPRSSNSFAVQAFKMSQPNTVRVATHIHHPCHVIRAIRLNVPVMLLIREPASAVISLKSLQYEKLARGIRRDVLFYIPTLAELFEYYYEFYSYLLPFRNKIVIVTFEEVITDFGKCIKKLNQFYGTSFCLFEHTPDNVEKILSKRFHIAPNKIRDRIKAEVNEEYIKSYPLIKAHVDKALGIYKAFLEL